MDRFSTALRRRNYNNRGLIRHHFVDDPCRIMPDGMLWTFLQVTYKEGRLMYSNDGGFTWNRIFNDATTPSDDLWYHLSPRSVAATDVQGPIIHVEPMPDIKGLFIFTGGKIPVGDYTHYFQYVNTFAMEAQEAPAFTIITAGNALEGVFAVSGYQHWIAVAFVGAADNKLYVDRFSPYDGSLAGVVDEDTYEYLNRYDMAANGQTGVCDIVIQADEAAGVTIYPVLKSWVTSKYTNATTCAITFGGTDFNDAFAVAESKHCAYIGGLNVAGVHAPTLIYDSKTTRYIYQCTSVVYGGNTYKDSLPGRPDANYTLFYAGLDYDIFVYEAGTPNCTLQDLREPIILIGYTGAPYENANVTGARNIDMLLVYLPGTPSYRSTVLVDNAKTTEAQNAFISSGFTIVKTITNVYINGGVGNNYTFDAAAITGAGGTLWGSDGCGGVRASADRVVNIGAPSAANSPEPEALTHASYLDIGIHGTYADSLSKEDVDLILSSFAGKDYSFFCRHSARVHYKGLLTTAGYGGFTEVESVFKSNGLRVDFTLQTAPLTAIGATLWGGDGCGGERTTGGGGSAAGLKHVRFDLGALTFGTVHDISEVSVVSLAVARDGYDNLCAVWGELDGTDVNMKYGISLDDGATWAISSPPVGGAATFVDAITSDPEARVDIIGGQDGGFLFMYVRENAGGINRLYVHQLTTNDGIIYTCGVAVEATSRPAAENIVGGHFFKPCEDTLLTLAIPGFVRIAYQVEEGTNELMLDATPVGFGQELLLSAFPVSTPSTITAGNVDFYTAGMTGSRTTVYMNAFDSLGITCLLRKYEPNADATMADRGAYGEPTEIEKKIILDPSSYSFPIPSLQTADQTAWIERDVRRIYVPPDFPLLRTFILNAGNFMKRTVWTVLLDGNEYEISQVVPRFVDDEIAFYEANAYVIGSSRDPWARTVLPSET